MTPTCWRCQGRGEFRVARWNALDSIWECVWKWCDCAAKKRRRVLDSIQRQADNRGVGIALTIPNHDTAVKEQCMATPAKRIPESLFWAKVDKSEGCWVWRAAVTQRGYGIVRFRGALIRAHRLSWQLSNGPIPDGLMVCHKCDNPPCVRPDHLFLGTAKDNALDMVAKGRNYSGAWCERDGVPRPRPLSEFCKNGHPRTPENLYRYGNRKGGGVCKACHAVYQKKYREARAVGQKYSRKWSEVGL